MAIDAKMSLINQIQKGLAVEVTANAMTAVLRIISDVIQGFDIRETNQQEEQVDDLMECFLDALKVQGRSEMTLERYRGSIKRMMNFVKVSTRRITVYHLRQYLAYMKEKGRQDSTMEGERQVMSAYFNWLFRESLIEKNPVANLGAIKCAKKQKKIFSKVDIDKLHRSCKCTRDRAIIAFLSSTGCRVSELTGLNRDAVDFKDMECIVHGKGNKERVVYIDELAATLLQKYLKERTDNCEALFANRFGKRLKPDGVREMLTRISKIAGVEHCHPHKFRRTLATNMSKRGIQIQMISAILGHDKLDTTMEYVVLDKDATKFE